jgi:hypothetical protein
MCEIVEIEKRGKIRGQQGTQKLQIFERTTGPVLEIIII